MKEQIISELKEIRDKVNNLISILENSTDDSFPDKKESAIDNLEKIITPSETGEKEYYVPGVKAEIKTIEAKEDKTVLPKIWTEKMEVEIIEDTAEIKKLLQKENLQGYFMNAEIELISGSKGTLTEVESETPTFTESVTGQQYFIPKSIIK